jgi:membrane protease YdiL (CAAX protease family)
VLGLGLGYLYEKRGTLLPSIVLHIIHNGVFIAYFFLAKRLLTVGE